MAHRDRQLSVFGVEARAPSPLDLEGLLAGAGEVARMGGTGRVSIVVADAWRAEALRDACAARGLVSTVEVVFPDRPEDAGVAELTAVPIEQDVEPPITIEDDLQPPDLGEPTVPAPRNGARKGSRAPVTKVAAPDESDEPREPPRPSAAGREAVTEQEAATEAEPPAGTAPGPTGTADGPTRTAPRLAGTAPEPMEAATSPEPAGAAPQPDGGALAVGGDVAQPVPPPEPTPVFRFRTAYSTTLAPLAARWSQEGTNHLQLDGLRLRLWVIAAGAMDGPRAFILRAADPADLYEDAADSYEDDPVGAALAAAGLPAARVTRHAGGPGYRIVGRRRIARLAELIGEPPRQVPQGVWPGEPV